MNKIEFCPYCGSDDVFPYGSDEGYWQVECGNCGAVGTDSESCDGAVSAWNMQSRKKWQELRPYRRMMAA